jgi:hypothetical protein
VEVLKIFRELGQRENNCLVMSWTRPARTGMLSVWCVLLGCVGLSQSTVADNAATATEGQTFKIVGTTRAPVWCVQFSRLTAHLSLPLSTNVLSFYPANHFWTLRWCEWCGVLCAKPSFPPACIAIGHHITPLFLLTSHLQHVWLPQPLLRQGRLLLQRIVSRAAVKLVCFWCVGTEVKAAWLRHLTARPSVSLL